MKLKFYGAAETVTGSCIGLTTMKGYKILLDCGLFKAQRKLRKGIMVNLNLIPLKLMRSLSHAHIDHSGLIPKLCKRFQREVYNQGY